MPQMSFAEATRAIRDLADKIQPHHPKLGEELYKFAVAADYNKTAHFNQPRTDISGNAITGA